MMVSYRSSPATTVIAMVNGATLAEHENPGEASVHVLAGRVRLTAGQHSREGRRGDLLMVPAASHSLEALEDSAVLLTMAKLGAGAAAPPPAQARHRGYLCPSWGPWRFTITRAVKQWRVTRAPE
jgi:hypothetical protein